MEGIYHSKQNMSTNRTINSLSQISKKFRIIHKTRLETLVGQEHIVNIQKCVKILGYQ